MFFCSSSVCPLDVSTRKWNSFFMATEIRGLCQFDAACGSIFDFVCSVVNIDTKLSLFWCFSTHYYYIIHLITWQMLLSKVTFILCLLLDIHDGSTTQGFSVLSTLQPPNRTQNRISLCIWVLKVYSLLYFISVYIIWLLTCLL